MPFGQLVACDPFVFLQAADLMSFIPNSALQEIGTQILRGVDPAVFKRPEDVTEKIMNDPTFGNAITLWGEKYLRSKK
jgi:hypothetical protein